MCWISTGIHFCLYTPDCEIAGCRLRQGDSLLKLVSVLTFHFLRCLTGGGRKWGSQSGGVATLGWIPSFHASSASSSPPRAPLHASSPRSAPPPPTPRVPPCSRDRRAAAAVHPPASTATRFPGARWACRQCWNTRGVFLLSVWAGAPELCW